MKWRPYWYKMSARQKKGCIILAALSLVLMVMPGKSDPVGERFHWQDVVPGWFGLSLGEFVFYMILWNILWISLFIPFLLRERRKKMREELKRRLVVT